MGSISYHSNQSFYPTGIKKNKNNLSCRGLVYMFLTGTCIPSTGFTSQTVSMKIFEYFVENVP